MSTVHKVVKNRIKINWKQFLSTTGLWFVGIMINALPVVYNCLRTFLTVKQHMDIVQLFWTDQSILFINFSTGFLLFLEIYFMEQRYETFSKGMGAILIAYTFVLIIVYTVSFFSPNWNERVGVAVNMRINIATLLVLIVLGLIVFVISSIEIKREVGTI